MAALAAALLLPVLTLAQHPASAAGFCGLTGMPTYRWTGGGDGESWSDPQNWDRGAVPGLRPPAGEASTDYACIDGSVRPGVPVRVRIAGGESAHLQALDVDKGATLAVDPGAKLFLDGAPATRPSIVRGGAPASALTVTAGTLGGAGQLTVAGTMVWRSLISGAATQTTRECDLAVAECPDGPLLAAPGRTVIATTGLLYVDGRGVNLEDKRVIDNYGVTAISGQGYIAADHGTVFRNLSTTTSTGVLRRGELRIANDRGVFEGRARYGIASRAVVYNVGLLSKTAGVGTALVDAVYGEGRSGAGLIAVGSGRLSINGDTTQTAAVKQGASYSSGGCQAVSSTCTAPVATTADPQLTSVALPAVSTTSAQVTMQELPAERVAPMVGVPVHVTTQGFAATATRPMRFTFTLDFSLLGGKTLKELIVWRKADGAATYTPLQDCDGNGLPPSGSLSCVDRRLLAGASRTLPDGDVELVVRTTQNSRFMAR